MTLKISDLKGIVDELQRDGYQLQVPEGVLYRKIQERHGISSYVVTRIAKALSDFGFARPLGNGLWEIRYGNPTVQSTETLGEKV